MNDLLFPGYGGWLADDEFEWVVGHLRKDPALRRNWGLLGRERTQYPLWLVQVISMWGDPEFNTRNSRLVALGRYFRRQVKSTSPKAIAVEVVEKLREYVQKEKLPRPEEISGYKKRAVPKGLAAAHEALRRKREVAS